MVYILQPIKGKYLLEVRYDNGNVEIFTFADIVDAVDKILELDTGGEPIEKLIA